MTTISRKAHLHPLYQLLIRARRAARSAYRLEFWVSLSDCIRAPDVLQYPPSARTRRLLDQARAGVWD
jgi:hypothetical protein